jgi:dCMP deaminase
MTDRVDKNTYYLGIAAGVAGEPYNTSRSTCLRSHYGAVIVRFGNPDDHVLSTGYNGAARGQDHCLDTGCKRNGSETRKNYENCVAVHAEENAMLNAHEPLHGSVVFIVGFDAKTKEMKTKEKCLPCKWCMRRLLNAGVSKVVVPGDLVDGRITWQEYDLFVLSKHFYKT